MHMPCIAAFAASVCAMPVWAEEPVRLYVPAAGYASGIGRTFVEIRESEEPGAAAEVIFQNEPINGHNDNRTYSLEWSGVTTQFRFVWNQGDGGADGIEIIPPAGYDCLPECVAVVREGGSAVVYIVPAMS